MNQILKSLVALTTLGLGANAFGQGLVSLRPDKDEFARRLPLTITLDAGAGYDSNVNQSPTDAHDSGYLSAGIGAEYRGGDRRTTYNVTGSYSGFYYLDPAPGQDDYQQSARVGLNVRHKVNPRLTISDSLYAAYEFEPNYAIGSGTTRRSQEYLYAYNDLSVSYAWGRKFSTVTGYTISGMEYQEDSLEGESYLSHIFHQEFRYAVSQLTTAALTYRFATSSYDNGFGDYTSHFALVGVDHNFSRRLAGTVRVGAEFRDRDNGGTETSPYVEGNLRYRADKDTTFSIYGRYGLEDSSIGTYQSRSSIRVGATAQRRLTDRLTASGGLHYIHDAFDDSAGSVDSNYDEDVFFLSAGLNYDLYKNMSLTTNYSFTTVNSGNSLRDYDRHNVSLGLRYVW